MGPRSPSRTLLQPVGCLLLAVGLSQPLAAQGSGRIVGKVVESGKGAPIPDAFVEVIGSGLRTATGVDGRYTLLDVPAGTVSIRVRFIGYQPKVIMGIRVPAGGAVEQDIALLAQAIELEEITVAAELESGTVARALEEQRNSSAVVNAITAEQIAKSPDGDAAQAVQRVSGVSVQDGKYILVRGLGERYTTTLLNGARLPSPEPERKVVPLDLFPSGLLDGITTAKTFTPEQPGDFSGGAVNLRTREFPLRRRISVSTSAGMNTAATGHGLFKAPTTGRDWIGFGASQRKLPAGLGAAGNLSSATQPQINGFIAGFRNSWSALRGNGDANGGVGISIGGEDPIAGQRIGYLGSFTYSYGQEIRDQEYRALVVSGGPINQYAGETVRGSVLWGGLLNLSTRIGTSSKISFDNTFTRAADNEAVRLNGVAEEFQGAGTLALTRLTYTERSMRSSQIRGEHLLGERHWVDWSATSSATRRHEPDRSDLIYSTRIDPATGEVIPYAWTTFRQSAARTFSDVAENGVELGGSYRLLLGRLADATALKVGASWRHDDRDANATMYDIQNYGLTDQELAAAPEQIFSSSNAQAGKFGLVVNGQGGTYSATNKVLAGYAQLELPLTARLRLIGGARVERWDLSLNTVNSFGVPQPEVTRQMTDILPAVAFTYDLNEKQLIRVSASQTLSRPELRELSSVETFDILGGKNLRGNPSLSRALVQNFDTRWEWYPRPGETISIGVFAKHFRSPIERVLEASTGASKITFENAQAANNYGVEVEVRKGLGMIAPALAPFGVFVNTTLMTSKIKLSDRAAAVLANRDRPMVGQSAYMINAGLAWTDPSGGWSATVLYNVVGPRIVEAAQLPVRDDARELARHLLDASLQLPVLSTLSLKLDGRNLLDAPVRQEQAGFITQRYRTGRIFSLGLTWQP